LGTRVHRPSHTGRRRLRASSDVHSSESGRKEIGYAGVGVPLLLGVPGTQAGPMALSGWKPDFFLLLSGTTGSRALPVPASPSRSCLNWAFFSPAS
jgi:hypothetical protein